MNIKIVHPKCFVCKKKLIVPTWVYCNECNRKHDMRELARYRRDKLLGVRKVKKPKLKKMTTLQITMPFTLYNSDEGMRGIARRVWEMATEEDLKRNLAFYYKLSLFID